MVADMVEELSKRQSAAAPWSLSEKPYFTEGHNRLVEYMLILLLGISLD